MLFLLLLVSFHNVKAQPNAGARNESAQAAPAPLEGVGILLTAGIVLGAGITLKIRKTGFRKNDHSNGV